MCKLLVRWETNPHEKGVGRFDVADVRDDSVEWGNREGFPTFLRVWLPGVSVDDARFLMEREMDTTGPIDLESGRHTWTKYGRAWKIVENRITPPIYAQLEAAYMVSGEYVISDADGMLAWLEKRIDGSGKGSW